MFKTDQEVFAVGVLTRHYSTGINTVMLKTFINSNCQNCLEEREIETFRHFFLDYSAFTTLMLKYLRLHIFSEACVLAFNRFIPLSFGIIEDCISPET